MLEAVVDIQLIDTTLQDRGQETHSLPTGHILLPIHQSVSSRGDEWFELPLLHILNVAPWDLLLLTSFRHEIRDLEHPDMERQNINTGEKTNA